MGRRGVAIVGHLVSCILALAWPSPGFAQEAGGDAEFICLPVLRLWDGTLEDVRQIDRQPVPESYRTGTQSCGGPLQSSDLIAWHLRFGTEATATAALAFIYRRDDADIDRAASAPAHIRAALLKAERSQGELSASIESELNTQMEYMSAPLDNGTLAMSAAERFGSQTLRDRAARWLQEFERLRGQIPSPSETKADEGRSVAAAAFRKAMADVRLDRSVLTLRSSLALFDANRSQALADIARLDAVLAQQRTPVLTEIANYAFEGGPDFCDVPDYADAAVKIACKEERFFARDAVMFLYLDASAALLHGDDRKAEHLVRLYERDGKDNGIWRTWPRIVDPRIVAIRIGIAEMRVRRAREPKQPGQTVPDLDELSWALAGFVDAARLISPADDPVQFGHIARRALTIDAELKVLQHKSGERADDRLESTMSYFRLVLPRLQDVAGGRI